MYNGIVIMGNFDSFEHSVMEEMSWNMFSRNAGKPLYALLSQ